MNAHTGGLRNRYDYLPRDLPPRLRSRLMDLPFVARHPLPALALISLWGDVFNKFICKGFYRLTQPDMWQTCE
jgi:hypothetical protein